MWYTNSSVHYVAAQGQMQKRLGRSSNYGQFATEIENSDGNNSEKSCSGFYSIKLGVNC